MYMKRSRRMWKMHLKKAAMLIPVNPRQIQTGSPGCMNR